MSEQEPNEFECEAGQQNSPSLLWEFWEFLKYNKKWWLTPILIVLLIFGLLILVQGSAAAPWIYSIFG